MAVKTVRSSMFGLLVWLACVHLSLSDITIITAGEVQTLPGPLGSLQAVTFIECGLQPATLQSGNYTSSWTLPSREVITFGLPSSDTRFIIQQGPAQFQGFGSLPATLLIIQRLSYNDAGMYTCSVRNSSELSSPPVTATIELQLSLILTANATIVTAVDSDSNVKLRCEMSAYIRPDEQLQWFRDGQIIVSGENRRQISYVNGTMGGQLRELRTGSSRVAVLTISNPVLADSGTYTCSVMGTTQTVDVSLQVLDSTVFTTLTPQTEDSTSVGTTPTTNTTGPLPSNMFPLPAVIGTVAAVLGIIVLILIFVIVAVTIRRKKANSATLLSADFHENGAYASTNNGGSHTASMVMIPNYAKVDKLTPPPLPARPSTNLSLSVGNSVNSIAYEPPGYETPDVPLRKELSGKYDPYYDDPDNIKAQAEEKPYPAPPKKGGPRTYYDDVDIQFENEGTNAVAPPNPYDMSTVPLPADILSGSMPRVTNTSQSRNPDFSYPILNAGIPISDFNTDHDYDQIYSEPIDPTMLRNEFEFDAGSQEAIPYSAIYEDPLPLQEGVAPLMVTYDNIQEVKKLGMGQFGNVILAKTVGLSLKDLRLSEEDNDRNTSLLVAIKKLKIDAETCLTEGFNKEVKFMARLMHDNVIRLLGVCTTSESFIMMEYMENGDLNQFLQRQKLMPDTISGLQENEVTPIILLYIGVQIASGMHYLASHRFVHRDLATRNCLVGKDFVVKISDFGMSRSLYESAYYRVQGTLVLPIRWMACETFYGKFSVKSDAWAFGVVLWEIYTLGKVDPYDTMTDEEVIADAIRGPDRMLPIKPANCPQEVYDIMLRCWVHEPSMRADFGEIYSRLFMIYTRQAL